MENTSKALLIAAAVLIVIILVAFSVKVLNSPKDVTKEAEDVGGLISLATKSATEQLQASFDVQRDTPSGGGSVEPPEDSGATEVGSVEDDEEPNLEEYSECGFYNEEGKTLSWSKFKIEYEEAFNESNVIKSQDSSTSYFSADDRISGTMHMPSDIFELQEGCFLGCKKLTEIELGDTNITEIKNGVFVACSSLKSITIPASVTSIAQYAFVGCTSLTDIYYNGTKGEWESISGVDEAFNVLNDLGKITVHCIGIDGNIMTFVIN